MPILDYITDKRNRIVVGASTGIGLIVAAAVGISSWTPAFQVRDSSGQNVWNVDVAGRSTQSGSITTKTLTAASCDVKASSTGSLYCGTDATGAGGTSAFGTGNVITIGDSRYVNTSGDTMTGALKVRATVSGSVLHADNALTSSGGLRWMGVGSGNSLWLSDLDGAVVSVDNMESSDFGVFTCIQGLGCILDANTVSASQITDDSIGTTELDDDSNTPAAGAFVIVETGDVSFDYLSANAGTDITADLEEETHASEHNEGGADALTVESLASSCTDAQVLGGNGAGGAECQTDANTVTSVGQGLSLIAGLLTRLPNLTGSSLKVQGTMSGSNLVVSGRANCTFTGTSATGALVCNNTVGDTEMVAEDYGDFTNAGGADGFTIDANAVALTTDTTGNYAAGDAEAGNALTGDSATSFFSAGTLEIGIGGTGFGSCTDGGFVTGNGAGALTCNAVLSDNQIYIGDGTTEPTAVAMPECTSVQKIQYTDSGNGLTCVSDNNTVTNVGRGLGLASGVITLNATITGSLVRFTTVSGSAVYAKTSIASSGSLVVKGTADISGTLSGNLIRAAVSPMKIQATMSGGVYIGSGVLTAMIPEYASGWSLTRVLFGVGYAGATNATKLQIEQPRKAYRDMLSTAAQIDTAEFTSLDAATPYVINTANDDVSGGETIFFSFPTISTTAPKNPVVYIEISAP